MDLASQGDDARKEYFHALAPHYASRYAQLVIDALGGNVPADAAKVVHRIGFDLGHDACNILAQQITARVRATGTDKPGVTITREQVEAWAGHQLSDDDVSRLEACIPNSSIPDAVADIIASFREGGGRHE